MGLEPKVLEGRGRRLRRLGGELELAHDQRAAVEVARAVVHEPALVGREAGGVDASKFELLGELGLAER